MILFTSDYDLTNEVDIYNHYVAVTRAKEKVVIIHLSDSKAKKFEKSLSEIFNISKLHIEDLVTYK